jgi:hypothetical protein
MQTANKARQSSLSSHERQGFLALRSAITRLAKQQPRQAPKNHTEEQPFDALLLSISPLYRKSRELYLKSKGTFRSLLVSSPRTLSSPTLLEPLIQYSPVETEMIWAATDPIERKNAHHLLTLRTYVGSLFHEQNHRTLWTLLPPPPKDKEGIRRYLNFAESLVISADMALGDELGPKQARELYLTGTIYDPGTDVRKLGLNRREYRNYLQATTHATYLNLEFYEPREIGRGISALFPSIGALSERAAERSGNLDRSFVWNTNPAWQKKHRDKVAAALSSGRVSNRATLVLPEDPMDNRQQYLLAEQWFEALGL